MTACDSLIMGVPMVTLPGDRPVGRLCSSILQNVGHSELIAASPESYVNIAINMASDPTGLSKIRSELRPALERSPVMNAGGVAKELQGIFRNISH
jgi:predicted O-linked N-acetylglucosamine transferase (SPINDLY family)